jgi:outer membrane protein TolC
LRDGNDSTRSQSIDTACGIAPWAAAPRNARAIVPRSARTAPAVRPAEEEVMTRSVFALATCACAGGLLALPAFTARASGPESPDAAPAPPVDSLVALALERAPEIAAQRARAAAAGERIRPSGALDDPMLEIALQDAGFPDWTVGEEDMSMLGIDVRQTLPFPGKRAQRRRAATAEAAIPDADRRALERRVAAEVRALYARLYAIDRAGTALRSAAVLLRALDDASAARYAAGTSELDPKLAARLAVARLDERMEDLAAERRSVVAEMNRYLDRRADAAIGVADTLPADEPPPSDWQARATTTAASVAAARAVVVAAEQRAAAERRERFPDLTVGGGYGFRGDLGPLVTFRVGTALPLWRGRRQAPRIRAAEHEIAAAQHDLRRTAAEAGAAAEQLVADWQRSDAQVRRYRDTILPQSRIALDAARIAYASGRGSFSSVIQGFDLWLEAQQQLAAREAARFAAHARLAALVLPDAATEEGSR